MSLFQAWRAKTLALASTCAVGLGVISGCTSGGGGPSNQLASDQTLRFPIYSDFGTLDPDQANAETDTAICQNVFDNLVTFDKNLNIVPDIAASSPTVSSDKLTYTFHLKQNVTFSNGDHLTARDVLYSLNRAAALQGGYAYTLGAIAGYDKVAKNTAAGAALEALLEKQDPSVTMSGVTAPDGLDGFSVQIKLASQAGWFLPAMALQCSVGSIVDWKVVKQNPDNWWTDPATLVGTGAFKMVARVPKQSVDFDAVSNWWGAQKPTLKHVHLDIIQSASSGVTAWEQKKYDLDGYGGYSNIPVADVLRIKNNSSESNQLLFHPKGRTYWVSFNVGHTSTGGPFLGVDDVNAKNLRLAFSLAVDKQKLRQVVCQNLVCSPMTGGIIAKGLKGYLGDNQDPLMKFDPGRAKSLLQQADPDGSKTRNLTYVYDPENPLNAPTATFLQDQWKTNLGVQVNLQAVNHSQFIKARLKGDYVLSRDGWLFDYNHPQDWFDNLYGAIATAGGSNTSGYDTSQFDQLAKTADAQPLDQALPTYIQMSKMLSDAVAYIPLYQTQGEYLIHSWVQGAGTSAQLDYPWTTISILQH